MIGSRYEMMDVFPSRAENVLDKGEVLLPCFQHIASRARANWAISSRALVDSHVGLGLQAMAWL